VYYSNSIQCVDIGWIDSLQGLAALSLSSLGMLQGHFSNQGSYIYQVPKLVMFLLFFCAAPYYLAAHFQANGREGLL
jgi:hypothetical protein